MTTAQIPVAELREQSATVRPGRVLGTGVGALFFALGWLIGITWRGIVLLALVLWHNGLVYGAKAARYGYWKGAGRSVITGEQLKPPAGR